LAGEFLAEAAKFRVKFLGFSLNLRFDEIV